MLSSVITYVNNQIGALNLFEKRFGLCDIITDGEKTFPAEYCNGNYTSAVDFTNYQGVCYHRLEGNIDISQNEQESSTGCDIYSQKIFPLKSVFCVKKRPGAYSQEEMILDIEKVISRQNIKELSDLLGMDVVSVQVKSGVVDREALSQQEQNIKNAIGYEFAYFAILYDVIIEGDLSCQTINVC